jgi:uncharacterized membrane protein YcaP (DUF421 family)
MQQPVDWWHALYINLVQLGASNLAVSYTEKIIRPVAVYLLLVLALKKVGQRMLAQLNPFDFVVLLTLSNTVQNAIIGNDTSLVGGLVGALALLAINAALVRWYYRGPLQQQMKDESDVVLIEQHRIQEDTLRRFRINLGELTARAHERGFDDLSEVETAVLYPNGTIYMKGESEDSLRIQQILQELEGLRREVAALRG